MSRRSETARSATSAGSAPPADWASTSLRCLGDAGVDRIDRDGFDRFVEQVAQPLDGLLRQLCSLELEIELVDGGSAIGRDVNRRSNGFEFPEDDQRHAPTRSDGFDKPLGVGQLRSIGDNDGGLAPCGVTADTERE